MKQVSDLMGQLDIGAEMPPKGYSQHSQSNCEQTDLAKARYAKFWMRMMEIYSDRWTAKNGRAPSLLWKQAITALTDQQVDQAIAACVQRCWDGNSYAPDLADFMAIVGSSVNPFGLTTDDVVEEFSKYCRTRHRYSCAEKYPWRHDVLYWICKDLRMVGESSVEKMAGKFLKRWIAKVANGEEVPKPVPLLSESMAGHRKGMPGAGHSAAMEILARMRGGKPNTN